VRPAGAINEKIFGRLYPPFSEDEIRSARLIFTSFRAGVQPLLSDHFSQVPAMRDTLRLKASDTVAKPGTATVVVGAEILRWSLSAAWMADLLDSVGLYHAHRFAGESHTTCYSLETNHHDPPSTRVHAASDRNRIQCCELFASSVTDLHLSSGFFKSASVVSQCALFTGDQVPCHVRRTSFVVC